MWFESKLYPGTTSSEYTLQWVHTTPKTFSIVRIHVVTQSGVGKTTFLGSSVSPSINELLVTALHSSLSVIQWVSAGLIMSSLCVVWPTEVRLCIFKHVYMCTYTHMHTNHTHISCVYMYIYIYMCMFKYGYILQYKHICHINWNKVIISIYVCVCVCVYIFVYMTV